MVCALNKRPKELPEYISGYISWSSSGSKCQDRIKSVKRFIRGNAYGRKKERDNRSGENYRQ